MKTDEGAKTQIEEVTLDGEAADRIGPIEHHHAPTHLACRLHGERQRLQDERVDARPHVLDVEHQRVDIGEHLPGTGGAPRHRGCAPAARWPD